MGPGYGLDADDGMKALFCAGWTHLLHVDAIDTPHLDKTGTKRHRYVFTKLNDKIVTPRVVISFIALFPYQNENIPESFGDRLLLVMIIFYMVN